MPGSWPFKGLLDILAQVRAIFGNGLARDLHQLATWH